MLCDKCIEFIAKTVSREARSILNYLIDEGPKSKSQIQDGLLLSYSIASTRIDELEHKLLISHKIRGRANIYWLTRAGVRLSTMKGGEIR